MHLSLGKKNLLILYGISVFVFNSVFRSSVYTVIGITLPGMLGAINFLAIASLMLIYFFCMRRGINVKRSNMGIFLIIVAYSMLVYTANLNSKTGMAQYVLMSSILPGMLIIVQRFNELDMEVVFTSVLRCLNYIFIVVFSLGILDYFLGGIINYFIADYMSDPSWASMIRIENQTFGFRMCTILGAPLMNAYYALVILVLNNIHEKYLDKRLLNRYVLYGLCIITIVLTGSRSALLMGIIFILISELFGKWAIWRIVLLLVIIGVLINTPIFQETVGQRLEIGFMNESDARYLLVQQLMQNKFGQIKWLSGGGYNYSRTLTASAQSATLNFEYPFLMFAYDYGIIATTLYYFIFAIYPLWKMYKSKRYYMMFGYGVLLAFLQTCNITAQYYDFNLQLGFLAVTLLGVCNEDSKGRKYNE